MIESREPSPESGRDSREAQKFAFRITYLKPAERATIAKPSGNHLKTTLEDLQLS